MKRRYEDCSCTIGCDWCRGWPEIKIGRFTPNGRKIHSVEETREMNFPYPPEDEDQNPISK